MPNDDKEVKDSKSTTTAPPSTSAATETATPGNTSSANSTSTPVTAPAATSPIDVADIKIDIDSSSSGAATATAPSATSKIDEKMADLLKAGEMDIMEEFRQHAKDMASDPFTAAPLFTIDDEDEESDSKATASMTDVSPGSFFHRTGPADINLTFEEKEIEAELKQLAKTIRDDEKTAEELARRAPSKPITDHKTIEGLLKLKTGIAGKIDQAHNLVQQAYNLEVARKGEFEKFFFQ